MILVIACYYKPFAGESALGGVRFFSRGKRCPDGLNRYAYCGNNPVNYVDPSGHNPHYTTGDTIHGADGSTTVVGTDVGDGVFIGGGSTTSAPIVINVDIPEIAELTKPPNPDDNLDLPPLAEPAVPAPQATPAPAEVHVMGGGVDYDFAAAELNLTPSPTPGPTSGPTSAPKPAPTSNPINFVPQDPRKIKDIPPHDYNKVEKWACFWMAYDNFLLLGRNPGKWSYLKWVDGFENYSHTTKPLAKTYGYLFFFYNGKKGPSHTIGYEYAGGKEYKVWFTEGDKKDWVLGPDDIRNIPINNVPFSFFNYHYFVPVGEF